MEAMKLEEWYEANLSEGIETESSEDHLEEKLFDDHFYWMCTILTVDLDYPAIATSEFIKTKGYKCDTTLVKEAVKRFLKHGTPVSPNYKPLNESKTIESPNDNPSKFLCKENEICQLRMSKPVSDSINKILPLEHEINKKIATLPVNKIPPTTNNSKNQSTEAFQIQRIFIEELEKINRKEREQSKNQETYCELHFTCPDPQCMKQFKNKVDIMNHILCFHSLKCQMPFCNFSTFVFEEYLQHFRVNHSIKQALPAKRIVGYGHHAEF